jgi:hypothetical protein
VDATGTTPGLNIRFPDLNRVLFVVSVIAKNSAAAATSVLDPSIGTTSADYNVVGVTVIAAAGQTVAVTATAFGI